VVAKERDDVGNLLLFAFVVLNDDEEKNTGLLEEEEEEEKVRALLLIVVVIIRPRSACLVIISLSLENNARSDMMEKRANFFWETPLRAHDETVAFTFLQKKKEITCHYCV